MNATEQLEQMGYEVKFVDEYHSGDFSKFYTGYDYYIIDKFDNQYEVQLVASKSSKTLSTHPTKEAAIAAAKEHFANRILANLKPLQL